MQIALQTFIHKVDPSLSLPFVLLYSFLFLLVAGGLVAYLNPSLTGKIIFHKFSGYFV